MDQRTLHHEIQSCPTIIDRHRKNRMKSGIHARTSFHFLLEFATAKRMKSDMEHYNFKPQSLSMLNNINHSKHITDCRIKKQNIWMDFVQSDIMLRMDWK